ncbi:hypothetical protein [Alteromonas sp. CYL-A6]|uniref:hypothetical protein n=1 Tax=Alteromonas nitratireducens TaxID=3390813 RepID=UPI0034ADAEF5
MSALQRHLVNLDIVKDDIATLSAKDYASPAHVRLVEQYCRGLQQILDELDHVTENQFGVLVKQAGLHALLAKKQMVGVHLKMASNVLVFWEADQKAHAIIDAEFDEQADRRLDLLQVKAVRAKSQLKAAALAMGRDDYSQFANALGLSGENLEWEKLS